MTSGINCLTGLVKQRAIIITEKIFEFDKTALFDQLLKLFFIKKNSLSSFIQNRKLDYMFFEF